MVRGSFGVAALLLMEASGAEPIPTHIAAAVADAARPDTDRQRDPDRKPADVIAFAGIKPGDRVADFMPGRGYFTRLLCKAVGSTGHVYAISVPRNRPAASATPMQPSQEPAGHACDNVTAIALQMQKRPAPELWSSSNDPGEVYEYWTYSQPAENFAAPEPLDVIWTSENYHDLHNAAFGAPNMYVVNLALFNALKPGGLLMVEDHVAAAGSGVSATETLHRIDPAQVKKEVLAAGFVLAGESDVLRNAGDPHTAKAHELHGRTDRFLLKFRKP